MPDNLVLDTKLQSAKNLAWWLYIAHAASLVFALGALSWIPLIVSYLKRADAAGTFVYSHHTWQIRSFWWNLGWMVLGWLLFFTFFGIPVAMLIWGAAWLWMAYRMIKGIIELNADRPIGDYPESVG